MFWKESSYNVVSNALGNSTSVTCVNKLSQVISYRGFALPRRGDGVVLRRTIGFIFK